MSRPSASATAPLMLYSSCFRCNRCATRALTSGDDGPRKLSIAREVVRPAISDATALTATFNTYSILTTDPHAPQQGCVSLPQPRDAPLYSRAVQRTQEHRRRRLVPRDETIPAPASGRLNNNAFRPFFAQASLRSEETT